VSVPVSYGPHAAAIAVSLCLGQHLPVERTAGLLAELFGTPMSEGTVAAWTSRAAAGLAPFTAAARAGLAEADLVHADETGLRVAGQLHWLHVASSTRVIALFCHRRRGKLVVAAAADVDCPLRGVVSCRPRPEAGCSAHRTSFEASSPDPEQRSRGSRHTPRQRT
jgi:Transposase IS66 family